MITVEIDFDADEFEKSVTEQLISSTKSRLMSAGLTDLKVKLVKENGEMALHFLGPDDQIQRARVVLGIK